MEKMVTMRRGLGALAFATALIVVPAEASAAPKASDVYDDVRSIIEDLIVAKVGVGIPKAAAHAPVLCYHFRDAFELMNGNQWALVAPALRRGVSGLAADFTYTTISDGKTSTLADALKSYVKSPNPTLVGRALEMRTKGESCTTTSWAKALSRFETECKDTNARTDACEISRYVEAATLGERAEADAIGMNLAMKLLVEAQPGDARVGENEWSRLKFNQVTLGRALSQILSGDSALSASFAEVDSACDVRLAGLFAPRFDGRDTMCWGAYWASATGDNPPTRLSVTLGKEAPRQLSGPELASLLQAFHGSSPAEAVPKVLGESRTDKAGPLTHVTLADDTTVVFDSPIVNDKLVKGHRLPREISPANLALAWQRASTLTTQLGMAGDPWLQYRHVQTLWRSISAIQRNARSELVAGRTSAADALFAVIEIARLSSDTKKVARSVVSSRMFTPKDRSDLIALIQLVQAATPSFEDSARNDEQKNENLVRETYKRFLFDFAGYLVASDGPSADVARQAFRATTVSLLAQSRAAGFPAAGFGSWNWPAREQAKATDTKLGEARKPSVNGVTVLRNFFVPEVGLRVSFNNTYRNEIGSDGMRYEPTTVWGTLFRWGITEYTGVRLALLDPVAILTEIALRKGGEYSSLGWVAADGLRPRVDVYFGIPELTRDVVLTTGAGMRMIRAVHCSEEGQKCSAEQREPTVAERNYSYDPSVSLELSAAVLVVF